MEIIYANLNGTVVKLSSRNSLKSKVKNVNILSSPKPARTMDVRGKIMYRGFRFVQRTTSLCDEIKREVLVQQAQNSARIPTTVAAKLLLSQIR